MVKTTLRQLGRIPRKTGKAIQLLLHGIWFVSKHLELLEHRATTSAGRPVLVLRGIAEKNVALRSLLIVCSVLVQIASWFSYWLAMNVWQFLFNASVPFYCVLFCLVLIFRSGRPSWSDETYHSVKMIDAAMKEIINCKHNAKCLNFYFLSMW